MKCGVWNLYCKIHHEPGFKLFNTVVVLGGLLDRFLYFFHVHFVILLINFILTFKIKILSKIIEKIQNLEIILLETKIQNLKKIEMKIIQTKKILEIRKIETKIEKIHLKIETSDKIQNKCLKKN